MKHWIAIGVLLTVAGPLSGAVPASNGGPPCERSNQALLASAQRSADADYWMRIAAHLCDPSGQQSGALRDAYVEWRKARREAEQVFAARASACALFGHSVYHPTFVPAEFSAAITNPHLPYVPGRKLIYESDTAEGLERLVTTVSAEIVTIEGVPCREVREYETLDGVLVDDTRNWLSHHHSGDVWYFGELSLGYVDGQLDNLDGSWRAGKDTAQPGILMLGDPAVGAVYRQNFLIGQAEDIARVIRLDETVHVQAGTFEHCVVVEEWDPLEPLELLIEFFAPDVGLVLEINVLTGERLELVQIQD